MEVMSGQLRAPVVVSPEQNPVLVGQDAGWALSPPARRFVSAKCEARRLLAPHDAERPRQHSAGGSRFLCHIYNRFRCNKFIAKLGPGRRCAECTSLLPSATDVMCKLKSVLSTQ